MGRDNCLLIVSELNSAKGTRVPYCVRRRRRCVIWLVSEKVCLRPPAIFPTGGLLLYKTNIIQTVLMVAFLLLYSKSDVGMEKMDIFIVHDILYKSYRILLVSWWI